MQFILFEQWQKIKNYAAERDIKIIGDIPIFTAMDSADVWARKYLYHLDKNGYPECVAGVPPDYFSETGQLWGNPLYNWDVHEAEGYAWWISRVRNALKFVDIIRIDHFRGFESYWSIPYGEKTAKKGKWVKGPGDKIFIKMKEEFGSLPIIAEDLGIITDAVTELREGLGLPGMKVLQFGFDAGKNNWNMPHNFKTPLSAVYTGTHDNDTSLGWYKSAPPKVQDQFRKYSNVTGADCPWDMIRLAFYSIAAYAVIPIQDVLSLGSEARMNTPGESENNWKFRFKAEDLTEARAEGLKYLSELTDRNVKEEDEEEETEDKEVKPNE